MVQKSFLKLSRKERKIPRGELWIGGEVFDKLRLEDDIRSRLLLCGELGMDSLFLSLSIEGEQIKPFTYRSFTFSEIEKGIGGTDFFVGIILDGPLQRLSQKQGILSTLSLLSDGESFITRFEDQVTMLTSAISAISHLTIDTVVLADDIAYERATYMDPRLFEDLIAPYYRMIVNTIHERQCLAFFHSDGNWAQIFPSLVNCGFDGFAGCQWECMDLVSLRKMAKVLFMAGIDFPLLDSEIFEAPKRKALGEMVKHLSIGGGFMLTSSCGIHTMKHLQNLKRIYEWIDGSICDE